LDQLLSKAHLKQLQLVKIIFLVH